MRTPIIAGNWKMNKTVDEAVSLVREMRRGLNEVRGVDKVLCPPSVALAAVADILKPTTIKLGAQNMYWQDKGAYTGETSPLMLKGQVAGPFTLGTNLLDQDKRCSYYDDHLHDVVVKSVALKAMWQMAQLSAFGLPVMIFLDEPALLGFGSQTFITVSREDVIRDINEVVDAIHERGGLTGVHCEENTDWSLLMETGLDILDFDAYDHMQSITLYPAELRAFFERGGSRIRT